MSAEPTTIDHLDFPTPCTSETGCGNVATWSCDASHMTNQVICLTLALCDPCKALAEKLYDQRGAACTLHRTFVTLTWRHL
jgi:hypothetical protein